MAMESKRRTQSGILTRRQLRDSEDEQIILDLVASVVLGEPIAASRETFDKFYDREMPESVQLAAAFLAYGEDRIKTELLGTFSVLTDMISQVSTENYFLRSKIRPGGNNPIKGPFYALFMAVFDLVVRQEKSPGQNSRDFRCFNQYRRLAYIGRTLRHNGRPGGEISTRLKA
jgi:hypothetical protein